MYKKLSDKDRRRQHRKIHIRKSVYGTSARPRLTVTRSNKNLFVQAIDDDKGCTLASISTLESDFKSLKANIEGAEKLGEALGKRLKDKKIDSVVFDRNGYLYHGVIKALADATRKTGIVF